MAFDRDLYKTRLCTLYRRGYCPRQSCSFAHGNAELRRFSNSTYGRREFRGGDLRERLEKRHSPQNRPIVSRDAKGRNTNNEKFFPLNKEHSVSRSPVRGSDRRERKRQKLNDDLSDESAEQKYSDEESDKEHKDVHISYDHSRETFEEELKEIQSDIASLRAWKDDSEVSIEKIKQEADVLAAKNSELEAMLLKEQDEYKRIGSKIKKFIKVHLRLVRAQDEVKKSQARLKKLVDDFPSLDDITLTIHGEDSDVNIVSDGEQDHQIKQLSARTRSRNQETSDAGKNDIDVDVVDGDEKESKQKHSLIQDNTGAHKQSNHRGSTYDKDNKASSMHLGEQSYKTQFPNRNTGNLTESNCIDTASTLKLHTEDSLSPRNLLAEKTKVWDSVHCLPSTGIAAHAEDGDTEAVDIDGKEDTANDYNSQAGRSGVHHGAHNQDQMSMAKTLLTSLSSLANSVSSSYIKYKGNDEDVDIDKVDAEERCFDLNLLAEVD